MLGRCWRREGGGRNPGKGRTTTRIKSATAGPIPPKPSPTATVAPARGGGLCGEGLLCNKRGTERGRGGIVASWGRDGVGRMGLAYPDSCTSNATERERVERRLC